MQNISLPQLDLSKSKSKTAQSSHMGYIYAQGMCSGHSIIVMAFTDFFMKLALSPIKKIKNACVAFGTSFEGNVNGAMPIK